MDLIQGFQVARDVGLVGLCVWAIKEFVRRDEDRRALEHKVRFSSLHEKRVAITAELYRLLARAEEAFAYARDFSPGKEETSARMTAFGKSANDFFSYFAENRIWFEPKTCDLVDRFWQALKEAGVHFLLAERRTVTDPEKDNYLKSEAVVQERVGPLKREIEDEFRRLLGVLDPVPRSARSESGLLPYGP